MGAGIEWKGILACASGLILGLISIKNINPKQLLI